ncbi:hypothetical protein HCU66_21825 [Pseudomonas frederiksbergensis]|uniref:hypothetical protein n=1 Tax=Pseudomonas frederiksbergensis TaxID=104087 RepID=UPI00197F9D3A|nr:hypothetical protein [Pseudomonas frederiksbergensis]MBN3864871.1 hypothetical protein [Pseudomonas frederiksbergensis]
MNREHGVCGPPRQNKNPTLALARAVFPDRNIQPETKAWVPTADTAALTLTLNVYVIGQCLFDLDQKESRRRFSPAATIALTPGEASIDNAQRTCQAFET